MPAAPDTAALGRRALMHRAQIARVKTHSGLDGDKENGGSNFTSRRLKMST